MSSSANTAWVTYSRVSTDKQGRSGLGLDAQAASLKTFLDGRPNDRVVAAFTEIESGKNDARPQLAAALDACRLLGAKLLIPKLDRLARDVAFIAALMKSDVKFVVADMPEADAFRLHIEASVAESEAQRISLRTKAALQAAKQRGVRLGGFRGTALSDEARQLGREVRTQKADAYAARLSPVIAELRDGGATTYQRLADGLTGRGIPTPRGATNWTAMQAMRVSRRLEGLAA